MPDSCLHPEHRIPDRLLPYFAGLVYTCPGCGKESTPIILPKKG